jgi:hypothetical protein
VFYRSSSGYWTLPQPRVEEEAHTLYKHIQPNTAVKAVHRNPSNSQNTISITISSDVNAYSANLKPILQAVVFPGRHIVSWS